MNTLKTTATITLLTIAMGVNAYTGEISNKNWEEVKSYTDIMNDIDEGKKKQTKNLYYQNNKRIQAIEDQKRTDFTIKAPKTVDIYIRTTHTTIEDDFVVKNAPMWKKVLIKPKQEWEY